mmetsp:Transcript_86494/g.253157  ORF Transcript_86494/g.253157 Transcript_86494/m.253157 type:complete len:521 (-) Transcript_86494:147-1709(-)
MALRTLLLATASTLVVLGPIASAEPRATPAPAQFCKVGIVGAGWGGIYVSWRLGVDTGPEKGGVDAKDICIFEAYGRPGGRTYDTHVSDYLVDVGAYRFAGDMHLPADLIETALKLPSVCYDPTCTDDDVRGEVVWPYNEPLRKVVDFAGRNAGYGAPLELMLGQLRSAGARVQFGAELSGVEQAAEGWRLHFLSGSSAEVGSLVLNVPRIVLSRVTGLQKAFAGRWPAVSCVDRSFPKGVTEGRGTIKVYAVYEDAWWVSRLGLLRGTLEEMDTNPPVSIHYHDGEVLCRTGIDAGGAQIWKPAREVADRSVCRGVLQVFYRHSQLCPASNPGCMDYWAGLPRANASDPLTIAGAGSSVVEAVHKKLLAMHASNFHALNVSAAGIEAPKAVAYSFWARADVLPPGDRGLLSSPADVIFDRDLPESCGAGSVRDYQDMVQGTGAWAGVAPGLHLANNDFCAGRSAAWHGPWAEMSLLGAERVLLGAFKLPRPAWLNESYYAREVQGAGLHKPDAAKAVLV